MPSSNDPPKQATPHRPPGRGARVAYLAFGWVCVALGLVGVVLPAMPTTIFMLIALWAFARSSDRFRDWLYYHPRFGPALRRWTEHRVIPRSAKVAAVATMLVSVVAVGLLVRSIPLNISVAVILGSVAIYIVSRPSTVRDRKPMED